MANKGARESVALPEYSEGTQRVFERALEIAAKQLSEAQLNALRALVKEKRFHDVNAVVKAIRSEGADIEGGERAD